jgi:hypothetical protein
MLKMVEPRDDGVRPFPGRWGTRATGREVNMSSRDEEQPVLDAIEEQLRAENPELVGYFSAFSRMTPWIKAVKGCQAAARREVAPRRDVARHGKHRRTDRQGFAVATQSVLLIIAAMLLAVFVAGAVWWILSALY